jgi:transposase-like protein
MGKKGIPHRKFSKEEKMKYVRLHLEDHISVRQTEKEYGIETFLISSWVKRYLQDGKEALEPRNGNPYAALHRSKNLSEVEISRLKKDIGWMELV